MNAGRKIGCAAENVNACGLELSPRVGSGSGERPDASSIICGAVNSDEHPEFHGTFLTHSREKN